MKKKLHRSRQQRQEKIGLNNKQNHDILHVSTRIFLVPHYKLEYVSPHRQMSHINAKTIQ